MSDKVTGNENKKLIFVNICYIVALCIVLLPLLAIAKYNYPSADDWSFGCDTYNAVRQGEGIFTVLKLSFKTVSKYYMNWEGRFMIVFLASLQPGIWGEGYYCVVAWIIFAALIASQMIFFGMIFCQGGRRNRFLWIPVVVPTLMMQILFTPNVVESFYWYNGAVNYTFMFGLSLILMVLFLKLGTGSIKGWKMIPAGVTACILSIIIGGDNFSTSLSTLLFMLASYLLFPVLCGKEGCGNVSQKDDRTVWFDKVLFKNIVSRTWYLVLLLSACLMICICAPGVSKRLDGNFGGQTTGNAPYAVFMSLVRSATNIYSWTNVKIILMLFLIIPFIYMAVRNYYNNVGPEIVFNFKLPGVFTLVTFGIYASQMTPTLYVDGTVGGGRIAAILYYSYHFWLICNLCYWMGWIYGRKHKFKDAAVKMFSGAGRLVTRFIIPYCALIGLLLVGIIYMCDLKTVSSYKAYRDLRQGWARQYAVEWEERLRILHDSEITQVEFEPLTVYPETILYTDLQDEEGYTWVNSACARYYGKEKISVLSNDSE